MAYPLLQSISRRNLRRILYDTQKQHNFRYPACPPDCCRPSGQHLQEPINAFSSATLTSVFCAAWFAESHHRSRTTRRSLRTDGRPRRPRRLAVRSCGLCQRCRRLRKKNRISLSSMRRFAGVREARPSNYPFGSVLCSRRATLHRAHIARRKAETGIGR